jgi:DNA-binding beta-propeller fold protein YncE
MEKTMLMNRSTRFAGFATLAASLMCGMLAFAPSLSAQQPYKIIDKWKIGGDGGWDYLLADPPAHRLYITRGAQVLVLDTTTGKQVGAITGLHGTHGIALDNAGKFGYISDGGGNAVVVFDRGTLATVATIPTGGQNPDGIVFEPVTQTVWAFEGRSKDAAVIDAATRKLLVNIPLPGKPEFPAADGKGLVFDNIEDKNEIVRLDALGARSAGWPSSTKFAEWPLTDCDGPSGLAFDAAGYRLFSVCDKHMAITDAKSGKSLGSAGIGDGPDAAGWDAAAKLAFASCGEGVLAVVDSTKPNFPTIETLPTQRGARTMAYDATTDRVYVVTAEFGPRPEPTTENPRPRPPVLPGTFTVIVIGR